MAEELQAFVAEALVDGRVFLRRGAAAWLRGRVRVAGTASRRRSAAKAQGFATLSLVAVRVVDHLEHGRRVRAALLHAEVTAQAGLGRQHVPFVEAPHLLRVRKAMRRGNMPLKEAMKVVDVADEELPRVHVVRAVDRLREIDHHGPVCADQHVELREIAVHHARAQHLHRRPQQAIVHRAR